MLKIAPWPAEPAAPRAEPSSPAKPALPRTVPGPLGALARAPTRPVPPRPALRAGPGPRSTQAKPPAQHAGRVVHLVGRLTESVFSFLRPATEAIAHSGVEQCVVLLDEPRSRSWLAQFDASVHVVSTPDERGLIRRWRATRDIYRQVFAERAPTAVHLHGLLAWLHGADLARRANPQVRLFYSPHGVASSVWTRVFGSSLWWLVQTLRGRAAERTLVKVGADPRSAAAAPGGDADTIESPVGRVFLETASNTARRPLIVASSRTDQPRSALSFAQLAVLLGDESLGLSFNWIGATAAESRAALKAANVGVFDVKSDRERAQRLSCGWVYLAAGDAPGFPLFLVEAMALGLPCIAPDTPFTRAVIRHGETGFLCRNSSEMRQVIAELIDAPELRQRLGTAARLDARERFSEGAFRESVLSAYALPAAEAT